MSREPKRSSACWLFKARATITSWPGVQLAGVARGTPSVMRTASRARKISAKLRPTDIGYVIVRRIFLSGPMMYTVRTVAVCAGVRPSVGA